MEETTQANKILYLSFNQDLGCINCGTDKGFIIFNTKPFGVRFQKMFGSGAGIVEIVDSCNVVALVGGGQHPIAPPNKCMLWDDSEKKVVSELEYFNCVRGVKIRRDTLVVATDDKTRAYDLNNDLEEHYKIKTGSNELGLCDLSFTLDKPFLLTKTKKKGNVKVINFKERDEAQEVGNIQCHDNDIRTMRMNKDATKFVTTSELGTLVRIWDMETMNKIKEYRRGSDYANIQSVYFSDDSKFLIVSSDKTTVHIWSLTDEYKNTKSTLDFMSGVLPKYFSDEWSMAKLTVPDENFVSGMVRSEEQKDCYDIYVATYSGVFYHYVFLPKEKRLALKNEVKFLDISDSQ